MSDMHENDVVVDMAVRYSPSIGGPSFVGLVDSFPWQIGKGEWVVRLRGMQEAYAKHTGKTGDKAHRVFAASLNAIEAV